MSVALKLNQDVIDHLSGRSSLNIAYLNRQTFDDPALRAEIMGLFLAQVDGFRNSLMLPMTPLAWRHLSHTLRGAAAAVGAEEMAGLAQYWEEIAAPVTAEERSKRLDEIDFVLTKLKSKLISIG